MIREILIKKIGGKKMNNYYNFRDLLNTAEDEHNLKAWQAVAEWLSKYDPDSWNGSEWDLGNGSSLRPVYGDPVNDMYPITGYSIVY